MVRCTRARVQIRSARFGARAWWRSFARDRGATTLEFVAVVPVVVALAAAGWQLLIVGQAAWLSTAAATAAARAHALGTDPRAAGAAVLPARLRNGLNVDVQGDRVRVRIRVVTVLGRRSLTTVSAEAAMREQS